MPFACKKYSDGPLLSLRSAKSRIVGTWKIDKLYIDGIDSTDEYIQKFGCEIEFTKSNFGNPNEHWYLAYLNSCKNGKGVSGYWHFDDRKRKLIFVAGDSSINPIGPIGRGGTWTIYRLTKQELIMAITPPDNMVWNKPDGTTYKLELKK